MLASNLSPSGPVVQTTEQVSIDIVSTDPGVIIDVTFPVKSKLKPGSMVNIVVDDDTSALVLMRAGVTAVGTVKASFYPPAGIETTTTFNMHVQISAHELSQCA